LARENLGRMNSIYEARPWLKIYPEWAPHHIESPSTTALDDFKLSAKERPDAPAVYYFDHISTYGQIDRLSSSMAAALRDQGLERKDRIIIDLQNVPQFLIATYAAWKLGAIVVPLNPMYKEKELTYFCQDSGAKLFLTLDEILASLDTSFLQETAVETVITTSALDYGPPKGALPALLRDVTKHPIPGALDMQALLDTYKEKEVEDPSLGPADIAYLTYTSGTTGTPKGAMNTHGNLAFNARVYRDMLQMDARDVVLGVAPLFHITGEVAYLANASLVGAPIILYYRFDAAETLRLIERWRATMTVASITVYIALMNHSDISKRDLSSFVKAYSGGAPVSAAVVDRFEELTGRYIYNVYGMTETNSPSHLVPWGQRAPIDAESQALAVGVPVPDAVVKIMELETGALELGFDEIGEIVVAGPMVVPGYWEKEAETKHAIREGWIFTGDVGKMDRDGWFYVVDRKKDLIVASGYKIWPREVEDVLYQHPAVQEAAVVGVPDEYRGETVKAFVTLKKGMEHDLTPVDMIAFCKKQLAAYKYPRQVEFVPEIPKTPTGKFMRRLLRNGS
jgi:long-chain acyl-CoA synthetase